MKIALLLEREPFAEILEETLSRHLSAVSGRAQEVSWRGGLPKTSDLVARKKGLWLCNGQINAVFSARAESRIFETPWREYLGGHSFSRWVAHAGYLAVATAPLTRWHLASHHLWIRPDLDHPRSTLILGGNSRIRLIDFQHGLVTTVLKSRFDSAFLSRELEFRKSRDDVLALPIVEVLEEGQAFVEPLVHGSNADRLFDKRRASEALLAALESCIEMSGSTRKIAAVEGWVETSLESCQLAAQKAGFESTGLVRDALDLAVQLGERIVSSASILGGEVQVGLSHGDLQPGNVLVDEDKNWLIDWERVDKRVLGYDGLTLALNSRRNLSGLLERAEDLVRGAREDPIGVGVCSELRLREDSKRARVQMLLFFLEEIRFHLEENAMGPLVKPTPALRGLIDELSLLGRRDFWNET